MRKIIAFSISVALLISCCYCTAVGASSQVSFVTSSKAAILVEVGTGEVILSQNADIKLPMASTTKIMTTILALESGELDSEFLVPSEALLTEGSSMNLHDGELVTMTELCYGMMLPSGNDAANSVALTLADSYEDFAEMMNSKARELEMFDTNFVTPSGLHDENHYSTVSDMAKLTRYALGNEIFADICKTKNVRLSSENWEYDKFLTNSNKLLDKYEYCVGVKTGFTDEAGRCLVSAAKKDGVTLIAITLHSHDDWNEHIKMFGYGFSAAKNEILPEYTRDFVVDAVGGDENELECKLVEPPCIASIYGKIPETCEEIHLPSFVYAPIKKGDFVGYAEYSYNGEIFLRREILACNDIDYNYVEVKKTIYNSIVDFFKRLLFHFDI